MFAYCSSKSCDPKGTCSIGVLKEHVVLRAQKCPDCGYDLIWHQKKTKRAYSLASRRQKPRNRAVGLFDV